MFRAVSFSVYVEDRAHRAASVGGNVKVRASVPIETR